MTKTRNRDPNKPKTSMFRGVSLHPISKKFVAQIKHKAKSMYLGSFVNEETAAREYDKALYDAMQKGVVPFAISKLNFGIPATPLHIAPSTASIASTAIESNPEVRNSSSQYIGVSWYNERSKWKASCQIGKKKYYLGAFSTAEEAAKEYNNKIKSLACEQQDPEKKTKLLKRLYDVPNTKTIYPQNYTKRMKLVQHKPTDAATATQEQINLPPDLDFEAELVVLGLFNDLPTLDSPLRESVSPLLFRYASPDLLQQQLNDDFPIFRPDSPTLQF